MRVLHIASNFNNPVGGAAVFVNGLVSHLQNHNIHQIIVTNGPETTEKKFGPDNAEEIVCTLKAKKVGSYYIMFQGLAKVLREKKYDIAIVHGYGTYPADLISMLKVLRNFKKPSVINALGISGLKHGYLALKPSFHLSPSERIVRISHLVYEFTAGRLQMKKFDKIIITSEEERHYLSKIGLKEERTAIIPIAINDVFFKKESLVERKYILYVGRISWVKGIEVLLRAIKGLKEAGAEIICLIVGPDWGYKSKVQSLINELDIIDMVELRDMVSHEELVDIYSSAIVTVLPSSSESFPLTLVESMARGTPFISTPVGHIPELVERTHSGMLVPVGDSRALTESLLLLTSDTQLYSEMSRNGKRFAQDYRWEAVAKKYYQLFCELIQFRKR